MSNLPEGIDHFLQLAGWDGARIDPIAGDASFRRYFRLSRERDSAMLMHAPPPEEDPQEFLKVAGYLSAHGARAPAIFASEADKGWILLEDFGDDRMRDWLDENPHGEESAYKTAVDALIALHREPAGPFSAYDLAAYRREADLFIEWYCPAAGLKIDEASWAKAWDALLAPLASRQHPPVTVLRDYHAENIMLLGDPMRGGAQGLIDFQDALVGHRAYDLVSLLQDARRDVAPELEAAMLDHYCTQTGAQRDFRDDYVLLGAQRNAKIVGIFTRLFKRDGKKRYLDFVPRVWAAMERDLAHDVMAPVAAWFARNIPASLRESGGGRIA